MSSDPKDPFQDRNVRRYVLFSFTLIHILEKPLLPPDNLHLSFTGSSFGKNPGDRPNPYPAESGWFCKLYKHPHYFSF